MIRDLLAVLEGDDRRTLRVALTWMVVDALLQAVAVCLLVPMVESLLAGDTGAAARWLASMTVVGGLAMFAHYRQAMHGFTLAVTILSTLRDRLGEHVVRLPLGWFTGERAGELGRIGSTGVMTVCQSIAHLLQLVVIGVAMAGVIVAYLLLREPRLGLVALAASPLLWLTFRWSARALERSDEVAHATAVRANSAVLEFARCQPALRAFGRTTPDAPYAPLEAALERRAAAARRQLWWTVPGMLATGLVLQATYSAVILLGVSLAASGHIDAALLIGALALMARFTGPLAMVGELSGGLRMARNDLRRIREVLAAPPLAEPSTPLEPVTPGTVELREVDFAYADAPVLRRVSVRAEPGTVTAIVGPSGSGKSTLTRLIARFWDAQAGSVLVGGVDVRDQSAATLADQLALVFQDVYLFDDTLRANVRLGREDATEDEVDRAAALAGVEEIVRRLPDGWDTRVGEGGTLLSGGERQRVSIARALLKRAPIVVLDEATAALDPSHEHLVRASVRELARTSTVLVVAHTPAMISVADHVVVLEAGQVVEQGPPAILESAGGAFATLFAEREHAAGWRLA